ncbi:MAG TPA: DHA2 family efflux MFS transporter permease subunit [Verrucomicrobiota bacterium]|nr:DHA2 family efflux MFS transporter permease subunit [Verrucomicrobiota bacterium]
MNLARRFFQRIALAFEAPAPDWIAKRSGYLWLVVGTTCIGAFIGQLDASIVQLALPVLEREFDCGLSSVSWVAIGYLLAFAAALAPFARLSQTTGRKRLYIVGFLLFSLASALCGMAESLSSLVAFRILQGIGGSLLGANSVTILVGAAGPGRRGRAMGVFAAAQAIGVAAGPAVGGWLVSALGWRSVFWVTVPFGLAGALAAWLLVPPSPATPAKARFDWLGMVLLGPGLAALLLVLSEGHTWGFLSWKTTSVVLAAGLLLAGFVRREQRATAPLVRLSLLGRRDFAAGIVGITLSYGMLYGMFFLMSFALIRGGHLPPLEAGLHLAILPVALGLAAPVSGFLSERLGSRSLQVFGMIGCAAGLLLMNRVLEGSGNNRLAMIIALALFGAGLGLFISPNNSATLSAAPTAEAAVAGGLLNLFRVLGTSVGVAAASSMLSWRLDSAIGPVASLSLVPADVLFQASAQSLFLLLGFALVAALCSLIRAPAQPSASEPRRS